MRLPRPPKKGHLPCILTILSLLLVFGCPVARASRHLHASHPHQSRAHERSNGASGLRLLQGHSSQPEQQVEQQQVQQQQQQRQQPQQPRLLVQESQEVPKVEAVVIQEDDGAQQQPKQRLSPTQQSQAQRRGNFNPQGEADKQQALRDSAKNLTQLARAWFHHNASLAAEWPQVRKECHSECSERGNCNHETGECECAYGYSGPSCQEMLAPACRLTNSPDAIISCFEPGPRSCECQRQCQQLACGLLNQGTGKCALDAYVPEVCWHWPNRAAEEQLSDVPEYDDDEVQYWDRPGEWNGTHAGIQVARQHMRDVDGQGNFEYVPLRHCAGACGYRGKCVRLRPDRPPKCICYQGYLGSACEATATSATSEQSCLHNCNGRGACTYGFCQCQAGWWGRDCSRSKAYGPAEGLSPPRDRVRIYIYELPTWLAHRPSFVYDEIYKTHLWFLKLLSSNWTVRTENPWEANLFLMPIFANANGGNVGWQNGSAAHIEHVVQYINATYPFWRRDNGKSHFYWITNDWGVCRYPQQSPSVQNPIRITHFGYHIKGPVANPWFKDQWDCFDVHKDIVAPPHDATFAPGRGYKWPPLRQLLRDKTRLVFYSGWVENATQGYTNDYYSFGTRQALSRHFLKLNGSDPAVLFTTQLGKRYLEGLRSSVFCLNPIGYGWAIRLVTAAVHGCIPVTIQDGVYQPFEDQLPYHTFSLRFSTSDIPTLVQQLQRIPPSQVVAMYKALRRWHKGFMWQQELGGKAFEHTISSLHSRLHRKWGLIY